MNCERVRDGIQKLEEVIQNFRNSEKNKFLRHLRTCADCRRVISQEERGKAIYAVVTSFE